MRPCVTDEQLFANPVLVRTFVIFEMKISYTFLYFCTAVEGTRQV